MWVVYHICWSSHLFCIPDCVDEWREIVGAVGCFFLKNLSCIGSREEQEKLNVWVALLNLENMYGTEESLKKVFERALQFCEPMPVYQQLADIYAKSDKIKVWISECFDIILETTFLFVVIYPKVPCFVATSVSMCTSVFVSRRLRACIRRWWSVSVRIKQCGWATAPSCSSRVRVMLPVLFYRGR